MGKNGQQYVVCRLHEGKIEHCPLELPFTPEDQPQLHLKGAHTVHLTGFLEMEEEDELDEDSASSPSPHPGVPDSQGELSGVPGNRRAPAGMALGGSGVDPGAATFAEDEEGVGGMGPTEVPTPVVPSPPAWPAAVLLLLEAPQSGFS